MAYVKDLARPDSIIDPQIEYSNDPDKVYALAASLASTNAAQIKLTGGQIHLIEGLNTSAAPKYLRFYNLNRLPVVGTDIADLVIAVPASTAFALNQEGLRFRNGIAIAITGASPANDATAVAAGDITGLDVTYE